MTEIETGLPGVLNDIEPLYDCGNQLCAIHADLDVLCVKRMLSEYKEIERGRKTSQATLFSYACSYDLYCSSIRRVYDGGWECEREGREAGQTGSSRFRLPCPDLRIV